MQSKTQKGTVLPIHSNQPKDKQTNTETKKTYTQTHIYTPAHKHIYIYIYRKTQAYIQSWTQMKRKQSKHSQKEVAEKNIRRETRRST